MAKSTIVIYHGNCPDGFGAAFACWQLNKKRFTYHPGIHNQQPPRFMHKKLIFLDFCYTPDIMQRLLDDGNEIIVLDHHKTAQDRMKSIKHRRLIKNFDMTHSGAVMSWMYFNDNWDDSKVPLFFKYIEDRDLWNFKLENSNEFNLGLMSYKYDFEIWNELFKRDVETIAAEGKLSNTKFKKDIDELLGIPGMIIEREIGGHKVPTINLPYLYASEVGHILSKDKKFAAVYYETSEGYIYSLRSQADGGMDVAKIAEKYGGGGHKNASGFTVKEKL